MVDGRYQNQAKNATGQVAGHHPHLAAGNTNNSTAAINHWVRCDQRRTGSTKTSEVSCASIAVPPKQVALQGPGLLLLILTAV